MKKFLKKYPKRIIITALIVLLIAIIGTVNNYRTYRGETYNVVNPSTFRYLERIYGEGNVLHANDVPYWYVYGSDGGVFYKVEDGNYVYLLDTIKDRKLNNVFSMKTDSDSYSRDDTVAATIEVYGDRSLEFDSVMYVLEMFHKGHWYSVHTGKIGEDNEGEAIKLTGGESWEFSVKLDEVREVSDEPIKLKRGKYRLGKEVTLKTRISESDSKEINKVLKTWVSCEFEIK